MSDNVWWSLKTLDAMADRDRVFELLRTCEDFALLTNGEPATTDSVDEFFISTPPARDLSESLKLGIVDDENQLIGLVDVARGFPDPST